VEATVSVCYSVVRGCLNGSRDRHPLEAHGYRSVGLPGRNGRHRHSRRNMGYQGNNGGQHLREVRSETH